MVVTLFHLKRVPLSKPQLAFFRRAGKMAARQGAMGIEEIIKRKVASLRFWKKTKLYKKHPKWDFKFSVMTYNILSQNAMEDHMFLYRNCNPAFLMEDYRISRLLPEILQSQSDIICLQEVEQHAFLHRMKHVFHSNGFESIFKKKTGFRSDGCAILWRRNKFEFVRENPVEYRTASSKLMNRDNVGLIAVLKPIHPKMKNMLLHVATTHLIFNPRRGDIKLCQIRCLLAELERMALKEVRDDTRHYHPVILCGDFNIEPHSPLYQFIEQGSLVVRDVFAGDLSGQSEGKNKGGKVSGENLLMHKYGISNATRFEVITETQSDESSRRSENEAVDSRLNEPSATESNTAEGNVNNTPAQTEEPEGKKYSKWIDTLWTIGNGKGDLDLESKQHFSHDFNFVPVYKYHETSQNDLPITSMTGRDSNTVDHIFYNVKKKTCLKNYTEGVLRLLSLYTLMYTEDVTELGGLPNAGLGSDHMPLIAGFALCTHG